ncbi:MAG: tRNA (N6-threonylcarbamoyladenosine(37)-N6)-methyltransferase TrmO [Chloroflexota bacterium]
MTLRPIGVVRNGIGQRPEGGWKKVVSELILDPALGEALDSLEEFSHIILLYWMHQGQPENLTLKIHPMGKRELPLVGRLATRSPHRPNPVGASVVRLLGRRGNVLRVEGLDALDGTPVIDIKPYLPDDSVKDARVPSWVPRE